MILYSLRCECSHEFDHWFDNMADYDAKKGSLPCPACGSTKVSKAIMAPRVGKSDSGRAAAVPPPPTCQPGGCAGGMCPMAMGGP